MQNLIIHTDDNFTDCIQVSGAISINILAPASQCDAGARDTKMNGMESCRVSTHNSPIPCLTIRVLKLFIKSVWVYKR